MSKEIERQIKNFEGENFDELRDQLYVAFPHVATRVIDKAVSEAELNTAVYTQKDVEFLRKMIRAAQEDLNS